MSAKAPADPRFPKVSIVTPSFNHQRYIKECLESVRAQTYPNWEHIIIDDGSTDETAAVVRDYLDSRTRLILADHRGLAGLGRTYNEALGAATGDLIAILEGDDTWPPDKLERQIPPHESCRAALSWGNGILIDETGLKIGFSRSVQRENSPLLIPASEIVPNLLRENFVVPASGVVIRSEVLRRTGGFQQVEGAAFIDLSTWLGLCLVMEPEDRFLYVNAHLVNYRVHQQQVSGNNLRMLSSTVLITDSFVNSISERNIGKLRLNMRELKGIVSLHKARLAIATGQWGEARGFLQEAWAGRGISSKMVAVEAGVSLMFRRDLAGLSFRFQRRLPGLSVPIRRFVRFFNDDPKGQSPPEPDLLIEELRPELRGLECPGCGGDSRSGGLIPDWGEWRICRQCTLQFAEPRKLNPGASVLFQNAYLGREESAGFGDFAARLKTRDALRKAPHLWFWTPAFGEIFAWLRKKLEQGELVLDIGCGMGYVMLALRREGFTAVGLDVAEEAVRVNSLEGFRVWHGTVETIPSGWVNPSVVLALFMIHHVEEPAQFFATIKEKWPASSLVVAQYGPSNRGLQRSRPPRTLSLWNARALAVALRRAGYNPELREFNSSGAENLLLFKRIETEFDWRRVPSWLYRLAKRIEKGLATSFLIPFQLEGFAIVAFAEPR